MFKTIMHNIFRRSAAVAFACFAAAAGVGAPPATAQAPGAATVIKVACVGDSITAGVGASDGAHNYPNGLANLLGPRYQVGNYGESGATLLKDGDSPYWQRGGFAGSAAFAPNVVVIMLGANDTKPFNWVHQDQFAADYAALIDYYAALPTHPRLFVCLPPPVALPNYGITEATLEQEIPIIRQVAAQKRVPVIDVHAQVPDSPADFVDGVHPNDAGYGLLADAVFLGMTQSPLILPAGGGPFFGQVQVTLAPPIPGAQVRFTTNGIRPTASSALYRTPLVVTRSLTLQALAFHGKTPVGQANAASFTRLLPLPAQQAGGAAAPGLAFSYFEGTFRSVSDLAAQTPVMTGVGPDFSHLPHKQETNFGLRYEGYFDAPKTGLYTFDVTSDDGSALDIDGQRVVDDDGLYRVSTVTGQVALAQGRHTIRVLYFQATGGYFLHVTWQGPGLASQDIAAATLSHAQTP